jgi:hypothetical protein
MRPGREGNGKALLLRARPRQGAYGFFGVLYSSSFWNGFQTVS